MQPLSHYSDAYDHEAEKQYERSLRIESRKQEILSDPQLLDEAVGDQIMSRQPNAYLHLLSELANADSTTRKLALVNDFQNMMELVAERQAEGEME